MKKRFQIIVGLILALGVASGALAQQSGAAKFQGKWVGTNGNVIEIMVAKDGNVSIDYGALGGIRQGHLEGEKLIGEREHGTSEYLLKPDGTLDVKVYGGRTKSLLAEVTMTRAK